MADRFEKTLSRNLAAMRMGQETARDWWSSSQGLSDEVTEHSVIPSADHLSLE
jgi:hypothetical protein